MELELIKFLQAGQTAFYDVFFKMISILASYTGFIIVGAVLLYFNRRYFIVYGVTYGIAILFNYILKILINRPRPFEVDPSIQNFLPTVGQSMPSGHTVSICVILCFALFLIFLKSKSVWIRGLSLIFASLFLLSLIISRMYLGQHYLSDILVGIIIGVSFSIIGIWCYNKFGYKLWTKSKLKQKAK